MSGGGLTVEDLANRAHRPAWFVQDLLRDEQRRGHVEQDVRGRWRATAALVETYAGAFSNLGPMPKTKGDHRP